MKFPNLKKYFFAHVTIILFYFMVAFRFWAKWEIAQYPDYEYTYSDDVFVWYPGKFPLLFMAFCGILGWFTITFTIIEALFRKFVIEKYFPNLKFPFTIKLPKWLCVIHSVFFYGSLIPMVCIDTYFLILGIINIFS